MTRRSKRELERALADLDRGDGENRPGRYVIRRRVVDGDGETVDVHRKVFEL